MKKIQSKIAVIIVVATLVVALINGIVGGVMTQVSTITAIEQTLVETSKITALAAQNMISTYTLTIAEIASNTLLTDEEVSPEEKLAFLQGRVEAYYMRSFGIVETDGYDPVNKVDLSGEPFFEASLNGQQYVSTPYISEDKTDAYMVVSAPILKDGEVVAVLYFHCDTYLLQSIIESVAVGEEGDAYILDKNGTVIAYPDVQSVYDRKNVIQEAAAAPDDRELNALAEIEKEMIAGKTNIEECSYSDGSHRIQSYTPISGTDGWSIAVTISQNEFLRSAWMGNFLQLGIFVLIFILSLGVALAIGRSIAKPIIQCIERLRLLAQGDLKTPMPNIQSQDEVKVLADSTGELIESFNQILSEVGHSLDQIAQGDLRKSAFQTEFPGDFATLQSYLQMITEKLNLTMTGIVNSADQVSNGADQVAAASATLSHGATEQAGTIELLSDEIRELSEKINHTAEDAKNASKLSNSAQNELAAGIQTMRDLVAAVKEIERNSDEISKILKAIDDIAFQTNILALNAAVEAARAGAAGKGFAVVADEVRDLATKSAESAQSTALLIDQSVSATHKGAELANLTSEALEKIMTAFSESAQHVNQISEDAHYQSEAISNINERIREISVVVQSNSATSEEGAATSEELSSQADIMKDLVSKFVLDNHSATEFQNDHA